MRSKPYHKLFFILSFLVLSIRIFPQETLSLSEIAKELSPFITDTSIDNELQNIFKDILNNPQTLNQVLKQTFEKVKGNNLLKDLDMKFKTFQYDTVSAIGLEYSYQKAIKTSYMDSSAASSSGLNFSLVSNGNVVFIKKYNPNDFLKSGISISYFNSTGGAVEITDALSDSLTKIETELSNYTDIDSLNNSPLWRNYMKLVSQYLSTQIYFEFSLHTSLESNQDFSIKNYLYGASLGIDVKAWNKNSTLAQLNILDWPFAVTRWLSGTEENISPRGSALPTFIFDFNYVDPSADPLRKNLNETKKYPRFSFEATFKTLASNSLGSPIYFSADLRYYKSLNQSTEIKNLGLDESFYFVAAITQEKGLFVSYTTGSLPYDVKKDDVYAIGFNYSF